MRMNGAQQSPWAAEIFLFLFLSKKRKGNYIYDLNTNNSALDPVFYNDLILIYYQGTPKSKLKKF